MDLRRAMFAVCAGHHVGFHIAMVPARLSPERMDALRELGVDVEAVLKVGAWRTLNDVAVAHVPFPERN